MTGSVFAKILVTKLIKRISLTSLFMLNDSVLRQFEYEIHHNVCCVHRNLIISLFLSFLHVEIEPNNLKYNFRKSYPKRRHNWIWNMRITPVKAWSSYARALFSKSNSLFRSFVHSLKSWRAELEDANEAAIMLKKLSTFSWKMLTLMRKTLKSQMLL